VLVGSLTAPTGFASSKSDTCANALWKPASAALDDLARLRIQIDAGGTNPALAREFSKKLAALTAELGITLDQASRQVRERAEELRDGVRTHETEARADRARVQRSERELVPWINVHNFEEHEGEIEDFAFTADGRRVLSGGDDSRVRLWDRQTGALLQSFKPFQLFTYRVAINASGNRVALQSRFSNLTEIWDATSGARLHTLQSGSSEVIAADFSPDGRTLVIAYDNESPELWDVESGKLLRHLHELPIRTRIGHASRYTPLAAYSPDGRWIFTGSSYGVARVWDAHTGALVHRLGNDEGYGDYLSAIQLSPDGRSIVTATHRGIASIWNATTGELVHTLSKHTDWVNSTAFSPDSRLIATGSNDKTARIWDAVTGKQLHVLRYSGKKHEMGRVRSVAFSADGRRLLTAGDDQSPRLWDVRTGKLVQSLSGHSTWVKRAAFSPDGGLILTSDHADIRVWQQATP
jgi:WD40 repeat protein